MDATTFRQQAVIKQLNEDYIAVKVDHDARPDLANKYRNYGWPATIIFAPDGSELLKRAGYIEAETFIPLLAHFSSYLGELIVKSKRKAAMANANGLLTTRTPQRLSDSLRDQLIENHRRSFDSELGSLNIKKKLPETKVKRPGQSRLLLPPGCSSTRSGEAPTNTRLTATGYILITKNSCSPRPGICVYILSRTMN